VPSEAFFDIGMAGLQQISGLSNVLHELEKLRCLLRALVGISIACKTGLATDPQRVAEVL
jgi:hypothetical protein